MHVYIHTYICKIYSIYHDGKYTYDCYGQQVQHVCYTMWQLHYRYPTNNKIMIIYTFKNPTLSPILFLVLVKLLNNCSTRPN